MKILVTGGAGYIGSILIPMLLSEGYEVIVVDNLMYRQTSLASSITNKRLEFVVGDVRNDSIMKPLLRKADVIIPLAAIVGAPACEKDPILATSVNKDSIFSLLSQTSKDQFIIMPTTNSAYGSGNQDNFCDENSKLSPLSLYARDKVEVEQKLMEKNNATSLRLATVFGISPRMRLDLLVNNFVFRAITDGYIVLFESKFKRNYVHVSDVARLILMIISDSPKFKGEIFNVGLSSANISKAELCAEISKIIPSFIYVESEFRSDPDQRNYVVSNGKVERAGFTPQVSLQQGLVELTKGLPLFIHRPHTNL